jgi:hypothetical protein
LRNGAARRELTGEGADGGDARTESGAGEGLWWWKTGEEDAWVMETNARCTSAVRGVRNFFPPAGDGSILTGRGGEGWTLRGGGAREREGEGGGPWHGME